MSTVTRGECNWPSPRQNHPLSRYSRWAAAYSHFVEWSIASVVLFARSIGDRCILRSSPAKGSESVRRSRKDFIMQINNMSSNTDQICLDISVCTDFIALAHSCTPEGLPDPVSPAGQDEESTTASGDVRWPPQEFAVRAFSSLAHTFAGYGSIGSAYERIEVFPHTCTRTQWSSIKLQEYYCNFVRNLSYVYGIVEFSNNTTDATLGIIDTRVQVRVYRLLRVLFRVMSW